MAKLIDLQVLDNFKLRQDAANDAYFIKRSNITTDSSSKNIKIAVNESGTPLQALTPDSKLDVSKLDGIIDISHIPATAQERVVNVTGNTPAEWGMTTAKVQKGDVVRVSGPTTASNYGKMYFVVDDTKLTTDAGYQVFKAGVAAEVPWTGVTGKPSVGNANTPIYLDGTNTPKTCTVVNTITDSDNGSIIVKTNGNSQSIDVYTHPTSAGNKHIPSGGSANQFLKYSASGTAVWSNRVVIATTAPTGSDLVAGAIWIEP